MEFDRNRYKVYTWKNGLLLHWIINPGLAINELILGQRVPKVYLEDRTSDKPRFERSLIPCPHCKKLHDGRTWSLSNGTAFKNWYGLYCSNCGQVIPCIMNATTFLILAITAPLWYWFRKPLYERWLHAQPARFQNLRFEANPFGDKQWIKLGLFWGLFMLLFMNVLVPIASKEPIEAKRFIVSTPIWLIAGLVYGYVMRKYFSKKPVVKPASGSES